MNVNVIYKNLLLEIINGGEAISTRNHDTFSHINLPSITFNETPLITSRKTAWRKALKEMAWFVSGSTGKCPEELLDWWQGQLSTDYPNEYLAGYNIQFRNSTYLADEGASASGFDQIKYILDGLKNNPNSRRLILTSWNPGEMANITTINNNPNTPTTCHNTCTQFFVRNNKLYMKTYQRSADMLLGVPHNWLQSWALLLYLSFHSNLEVGELIWTFGDAHIYNEESHRQVVYNLLDINYSEYENNNSRIPILLYNPVDIQYDWNDVPIFKESDFFMKGEIPEPLITIRPKLL